MTKDHHPSITRDDIFDQIFDLYEYAKTAPDKEFLVAYKGTGTNLNGYTPEEMAQLFGSHDVPRNIIFEKSFSMLVAKFCPHFYAERYHIIRKSK